MEKFDINRFLKVLFSSKLYIAFILIIFVVMGYLYSYYYVTPMYKSSATVVLVQNGNSEVLGSNDSITQNDITLNQNLLSTYTKIAKSDKVLEQVIKKLKLNISVQDLSSLINVEAVSNTEVFKISVINPNNVLAANITNELLNTFSQEVQDLYNMNNVYAMDYAEVSNSPYNINHIKDISVFTIIGVIAALSMVVIIYLLDTTIKSEKDVEEYAGLSVLSTIPVYQTKNKKYFNELIVQELPKSPISECFKTFRTNVMFSIQNKELNTILVTSSLMGEGKSFVSANLAVTFAQSGKKVILVDTDMRKGRVHKVFGLSHKHGLSNCLSSINRDGKLVNINDFIKRTEIPNLHIMTSGDVPPNPSELLSSPNMQRFLTALNSQYDVVICDGTPCMLVSDSVILSKIVDTTVVVTSYKTTKLDNLIKVKKAIEIVGGNIGGVVINKMAMNSKSYHNQYYYGNSNDLDENIAFNMAVSDTILDNMLCIDETIACVLPDIDTNNFENNSTLNSENFNYNELAHMLNHNLKEISELKLLYKNMMISTLEDRQQSNVANSNIVKALLDIKHSYEENLSSLNENILNEISTLKDTYVDLLSKETEEITYLNKLSNIKIEDSNNEILDEINDLKNSYSSYMQSQNEQIDALNDAIYDVQANNDDYLLNNLSKIYKQLQNINSKFDLLDKKSINNEAIIKNLNKPNKVSNNSTNNFDIKQLNDKVIKIQDYLESKYNSVINKNNLLNNDTKTDEQINMIDNLVDNSENELSTVEDIVESNIEDIIEEKALVNNDNRKSKEKRSMLKRKKVVNDYIADEEPVEIVSQILCGNDTNENVG